MIFSALLLAPSSWLVVPGRSLGYVRLGRDLSSLALLGRPQYGDAAMQKSWSTWIGKSGGRIDVFESNDEVGTARERRRIHLIRATSSRFHLANRLHPGQSAGKIKSVYPAAQAIHSYISPSGKVVIWDDIKRGLGWEAAPNGRILSLIVHDAGRSPTATMVPYITSPLQKG